jgi:hypothetical protein
MLAGDDGKALSRRVRESAAGLPLLAVALIALLSPVRAWGDVQTVSAGFLLERDNATVGEVVRGKIYHASPDFTLVAISEPIVQFMRIDSTSATIYYPAERRAIRVAAASTLTLPFFHSFVNLPDVGSDLSRLGFRISKSEITADSLMIHWDPPRTLSGSLSSVKMAFHGARLAYVELYDVDHNVSQRIAYADYVRYGETDFPLRIEASNYKPKETHERILFMSPRFDEALPDSILSFVIPVDITIEDLSR